MEAIPENNGAPSSLSRDSITGLEHKANQCAVPKHRSSPMKKSTSPSAVPALCRDDGESEADFESEDDGFDRPHLPQLDAMDLDADADGEPDMEDEDEVEEEPKKDEEKPSKSRPVLFDDDGESEMEEVESDDEPDIPLASLHTPLQPAMPYLHISHRLFPGYNRPFGELTAGSSSTVFAKESQPGSPFVPYARAPPPYAHGVIQRAWHVPEQGVMRTKSPKRRGRAAIYGEGIVTSPGREGQSTSPQALTGGPASQCLTYQFPPQTVEEKPRRIVRRPYPCLYKDCTLAFPSPKDRGRHMDKHFEGRFECMRCHKRYARVDALKRHCSEMFKSRRGENTGTSTRSYAPTASCVGAFETKEWKELSESLWLKPEHALNLRLPDPQDPLYSQISRLLHEAHYNARMAAVKQEGQSASDASTSAHTSLDSLGPLIKLEPLSDDLPDVEMSVQESSATRVSATSELSATSRAPFPRDTQVLSLAEVTLTQKQENPVPAPNAVQPSPSDRPRSSIVTTKPITPLESQVQCVMAA